VIAPKCVCGHSKAWHADEARESEFCPPFNGRCVRCVCSLYRPKRSLRAKVSKPIPRKSHPRKKVMPPRCKNCGHPHGKHAPLTSLTGGCLRCVACPGYEPARGVRQKRRGAVAAIRRMANDLWSKVVTSRPGGCECPRPEHNGPFQGAHGFGKKSYPAVRHLPINGWKLASGCHRFYTDHPIEWDEFMRQQLGPLAYEELRRLALKNEKPDLEETVRKLREELAKVSA
jgi:hypothetical protein